MAPTVACGPVLRCHVDETGILLRRSKKKLDPRWERWLERFDSSGTREGYDRDLTGWASWLEARGRAVHDATEQDMDTWMAGLRDRGLAASTAARKVNAVVSYYKWAAKAGLVEAPVRPDHRPKVHGDPVRRLGLPADELTALLDAAEPGLERALIALLAYTGVRISEAVNADVESLRRVHKHRVLHVTGKGGKRRSPAIPPQAWPPIEEYLAGRRSGPLFLDRNGERFTRQGAWRLVRRVGARVNIRVHPHLFRHTAAVLMIRANATVEQVRDALGHEDIKTTSIYLAALNTLDESPTYALARLLDETREAGR